MKTKNLQLLGYAATMAIAGVPALGASVLFLAGEPTVPNANDQDPGGIPVEGNATFTTALNRLTITLSNTTPLTMNAGELLTALEFTIKGLVSTPSFASATSIARTVDNTGKRTDLGPVDLKALNTWSAGAVGALNGINFTLDSQYGIIGPAESDGQTRYASANGSIAANVDNQPYAALTATFVLNILGVTDTSVIDNVMFRFGTGFQTCPSGIAGPATGLPPTVVPLPASMWSGGAMLAFMGTIGMIRRRRMAHPLDN